MADIIEKRYAGVQKTWFEVYDERDEFALRVIFKDGDVISINRVVLQFSYISTTWCNRKNETGGIITLDSSLTEFLTEAGSLFKTREMCLAEETSSRTEEGESKQRRQ